MMPGLDMVLVVVGFRPGGGGVELPIFGLYAGPKAAEVRLIPYFKIPVAYFSNP